MCAVALCLKAVCVGTDGEAELQWAAADQKAEKRRLQRGDGGEGAAGENPQVHCGEWAALATQHTLLSPPCVHD